MTGCIGHGGAGRSDQGWVISRFATAISRLIYPLPRIAAMAALTLATMGLALAPPPVDDEMVERALTGAEWLMASAAEAPERVEEAAVIVDLTSWLLVAGGADSAEYEAFAVYLSGVGYDDPMFAVADWLEEFPRVLAAAEAAQRAPELRTVSAIQAEIRTLPTVPLDEAGKIEREGLVRELILAMTPEAERAAAAAAVERIEALRAERLRRENQ
jgi:hypothetical protein